ncbi:hypothetical protein GCM10007388_11460 [Pseudoduganella plicata]|uniref:DUF3108 domain-containing protein n=1 Tax=Pseudoduganella plicata TaxID=321984 RepID=A0AA87Y8Y1_9BURK|nr:hypothetical protein GCM10007388_11460 [Pseudoduganella plicata]
MRRALLLAAMLPFVPVHAAGVTYGTHGMALFGGREALYASHLPMFHAPHDYQVILRVRLSDARLDGELRQRLDGHTALWTIDPEKFELDRLAPAAPAPLRAFRATVVQGHFEQGGKPQYRNVEIVVDEVLLFRRLSPQTLENASARYLQVGAGRLRFLVKTIDSRPDFDHIVAYRAAPGADSASVTVPKVGLKQPSARELAAALEVPAATIGGTVYFHTDDLR